MTCHNEPRFVGTAAAPLTIFTYSAMRTLLASGTGSIGNGLVQKVTAGTPHTGGNQCAQGGATAADAVCGPIIQWWQKEFPTSGTGQSGQATVTVDGKINGWALSTANPATKLTVSFYRDYPANQGGILMGTISAAGTQSGPYAGHYFSFTIPTAQIDNKAAHDLYVYLDTPGVDTLMPGSPVHYTAYQSTAAGTTYFNANLATPLQNQCVSCHAMSKDIAFGALLSPTPANGGTATNNDFIKRASGTNHPVNGCGTGINAGLCLAIQNWWKAEFQ